VVKGKTIKFFNPVDKHFAIPEKHCTISFPDLIKVWGGYKIKLQTWRFRSKTRVHFDDFQIRKELVKITFTNKFQKGIVDQNEFVHPFTVLPDGSLK
jgi:hypothetical protein